ncbi:MAG: hypothetical protein O9337_11235 [Acidovorax sp.]|uniref:hypothetical protein n=1 Tax=Acidovorax sp. TaxID=1872122 RepID=UPI0022C3F686|nr:hypothetical protein [Acidovorax sp.]MCZ8219984.1 hypothetical protein [Acidovorax sp.]
MAAILSESPMPDATTHPAAATACATPQWISMRKLPACNLYPCHIDNHPFDDALRLFAARSTRFRSTQGAPRAGRQFALRLASGRHALVTNYDDFPYSLEFSLQITQPARGQAAAYLADLEDLLKPLGLPVPDKSHDGALQWRSADTHRRAR